MFNRATRAVAKTALIVAQSSWLTVLGGYILIRSQWVVLPCFIAIVILMTLKCRRCETSFTDDRINQRFLRDRLRKG